MFCWSGPNRRRLDAAPALKVMPKRFSRGPPSVHGGQSGLPHSRVVVRSAVPRLTSGGAPTTVGGTPPVRLGPPLWQCGDAPSPPARSHRSNPPPQPTQCHTGGWTRWGLAAGVRVASLLLCPHRFPVLHPPGHQGQGLKRPELGHGPADGYSVCVCSGLAVASFLLANQGPS